MVAGGFGKHDKLLITEPVNWVDDTATTADETADEGSKLSGAIKLTVAEAKAGLAAQFDVSPDCVKITI